MASINGYIGAPGGEVVSSNINTWSTYSMISGTDAGGFTFTNLGTPTTPSSIVRVCDLSGGSFHWSLVSAISDVQMNGNSILDCESLSTNSISTGTARVGQLSSITINSGSLSTNQAYIANLTVGSINTSTITNSQFVTFTTQQTSGYPPSSFGWFGASQNIDSPYQDAPVYATSRLYALKNSNGDIIPQRCEYSFSLNTDIANGNNLYSQAMPNVYNYAEAPFSGTPVFSLPEDYGYTSYTPNIFTSKYGSPTTYWNSVNGCLVIPSTLGLGGQLNYDLGIQWRFSCDGTSGSEFVTSSNTPITWTNTPL